MISMSKFDMVQYLKNYANLMKRVVHNQESSFYDLFDTYMSESGESLNNCTEYYVRMCRVYQLYLFMKSYSYLEDFLLNRDDFLNNNTLSTINPKNAYSTEINKLTSKRILQLIRNAFNHNNEIDEIDRFKISPNAKNIEIEFLGVPHIDNATRAVRMKFDFTQIVELYIEMSEKRQNCLSISFELPANFDINADNLREQLGRIKFVHYYFRNKLTESEINALNSFSNTAGKTLEEIEQLSIDFNNLSSSLGDTAVYSLTEEQADRLYEYIKAYRETNPENFKEDWEPAIYYYLERLIPVPLLKEGLITNQLIFCERFVQDTERNLRQTLNEVLEILNGNNPYSLKDVYNQETLKIFAGRTRGENIGFLRDILNASFSAVFPAIMYIDAVVTHCCKNNEIITIDGVDYLADRVRNSLVHGRWYISTDNCIELFDADPRNINDYNLTFVGKINLNSFESWADNYVIHNYDRLKEAKWVKRR